MPAPAVAAGAKLAASSKTGRKLIFGVVALPIAMLAGAVIVIGLLASVVFGGGSPASAASCVPQVSKVADVQVELAEWETVQLENAAAIMAAASQLGLKRNAQVLGVQTALQESSLRVLNYGDHVGPDSRGLFQQRDNWGPLEVRLDPLKSSLLFFEALMKVSGWEKMAPEDAIHAVQINERASDYVPRRADAERIVDAWGKVSCSGNVPASAQEAAAMLVALQAEGRVHPMVPSHWQQVVDVANGTASPSCQVDTRVLQTLLLAAKWYSEVGFSDLGRLCVRDCSYGAGSSSMHCQSPAQALDLTRLGDMGLSGADANSIDFVQRLASVLPEGSGIGQSDCRARVGGSVQTPGIRQFPDSCNHLHIEMPLNDAPLNIQHR